MPWYRKEDQTPFDQKLITGLCYRDTTMLSSTLVPLTDMKSPLIAFPSGEIFEIWGESVPQVIVAPGVDVPFTANSEDAYEQLLEAAGECGYTIFEVAPDTLEIWHHASETVFFVTYDPANGKIVDIIAATP